MADVGVLKQIFSIESAAWAGVGILFLFVLRLWNGSPAMFAQWIAYKRAKAEEKAAHFHHLQEEIKRLSDAERQCRADFDDLHGKHMGIVERLSSLEGYMAGQGRASQEAAGVVALERMNRNDRKSEASDD